MPTRSSPTSLADVIRGWDDAALRDLFRLRPDLATPAPVDTTQLVSRAATRTSLARTMDRLDRFHLAVVEALAALSEPATTGQVAGLLQAPRPRVTQALEHLHRLALVWPASRRWRLVRAVHDVLGPHPAGLGPWWRDPRVEDVGTLLEGVSPPERAVLDRLAWGPPTGSVRNLRADVDLAAGSPVEQLVARGLLMRVDPRTVVLPREVGLHLRDHRLYPDPVHEPPAVEATERSAALVDRTAAGAAFDVVRRVEVLVEHWGSAPPAVLRGGGLGIRDLRACAELLGVDEHTAALHVEIAHEAGLVGAGDDDELDEAWLPTEEADLWLGRTPAARWRVLADAWLRTERTMGLVGRRDDRDRLVNALAPDLERTLTPDIRRLTLGVVASVPGAPEPSTVVRRVGWLRPRRTALRDDVVAWSLEEAAVLGITGLGAMSSHGRALLDAGDVDSVLEPLVPRFVDHVLLQADLTAVAPGPLEPDLATDVALCADVESRGGATVYRFTGESVRRALDAGWSAAQLHAFLAARSRTPVPQPLTYLVDDVARRHGALRVGVAESYLRCDDAATVAGLLADPRAAGLRLRQVSETVLVTDLSPELLLDRLRELGQAPVAEGPGGAASGAAVRQRRARPAHRRPRRAHEVRVLTDSDVDRVVAAVRAGDRATAARPVEEPGQVPADVMHVLAALRDAAESGASVWLRYVDRHGGLTERVVDPIRVDGGWLTAHDHRADTTRTFAVHRISAVSRTG